MATAGDILARFNEIKTLPHVAIKLSQLISDENSSLNQFEELIRMDPGLVIRLLRTVNSPYYGLMNKVDSISRAVMFIGLKGLRNMVVTEALRDIFRLGPDEEIFSRNRLWLHSAAVAICSQMIAERIFGLKGEDAYLCGILHDIGLIVADQTVHAKLIEVFSAYAPARSLTEIENEIVGTNHTVIGAQLAKQWNLPETVQEGIRQHHRYREFIKPGSPAGLVQCADYIVSQMSYAMVPNYRALLAPEIADHIKLNLQEYKALTRDLPDEMARARELYEGAAHD
ncbi:MAG: hypothetical protein BWY87_00677 [Deltaproteobacteria bacterium ADurb.Bin510]|nr:MAG: hypothetical protein BWY87_00677 [Deltaproteobacteria bacterium ADurb.Bin510]